MDKNFIGWVLMFIILMTFFKYNERKIEVANPSVDVIVQKGNTPRDEIMTFDKLRSMREDVCSKENCFGDEKNNKLLLENSDIKISFSRLGGTIKEVVLKKYKCYGGQDLVLCDYDSLIEDLNIKIKINNVYNSVQEEECHVCFVPFEVREYEKEGMNVIEFLYKDTQKGVVIKNIFSLDSFSGYGLNREVEVVSKKNNVSIESVKMQIDDKIKQQEKNLKDCQWRTTIKYLDSEENKVELNAFYDTKQEKVCEKVKWVNIMQKFFSFVITSEEGLDNVVLTLNPATKEESFVKRASVGFDVFNKTEKKPLGKINKKIRYYFGPNDVYDMKKMGIGLEKSIYLGWPGVRVISRYLYLPILKKMDEKKIPAWLIIIILILFLKILLSPLLLRSYKNMVLMKVLSPYLEEIQSKYGSDFFAAAEERRAFLQKAKVNPLGGMLAGFLQIPFWNAIFNIFPYSILFRQKSFLWSDDMSTYDSVLKFNFNIPFIGDHISLFALLMLIFILIQMSFSFPKMKISFMKLTLAVFFFGFLFVVNNNSCVAFTFYFFVSSFVTVCLTKLIKFFIDEEKIKNEVERNLKKESSLKERLKIS